MKTLLDTIKRKWAEYIFEILVITLGIWGAHMLNNWNQERSNHKEELKALIGLKTEFSINKDKIEARQNRRLRLIEPIKEYQQKLYDGKLSYKNMVAFHSNRFGEGTTNPTYGVINSLISSGDIRLISNDSLKYLVTDWKDRLGDFLENEKIHFDMSFELIDYIATHFPNEQWHDWTRKEIRKRCLEETKKIEYRNSISRVQVYLNNAIQKSNKIERRLDLIIELLDKEIAKN